MGSDQEQNRWRCDPNNGKYYDYRNAVFNETSSWWSTNHETLLNIDALNKDLESSKVYLTLIRVKRLSKKNPFVFIINNHVI